MTDCFQVTTTLDSQAAAASMATTLVEERLAACVQVIGPVESVYRWKDGIERASEWLCAAKTTEASLPALLDRIRALHSYQQPEIVATLISAGDAGYLNWIRRESTPSTELR